MYMYKLNTNSEKAEPERKSEHTA